MLTVGGGIKILHKQSPIFWRLLANPNKWLCVLKDWWICPSRKKS